MFFSCMVPTLYILLMNTSIANILNQTGLDPKATELYLILLEHGEITVGELLDKTPLSRATVYTTLPELLAHHLVEYRKSGREAYYKPTHPNKLYELLEDRKRDMHALEQALSDTVSTLTTQFQTISTRPGIEYHAGYSGVRKVLFDTLNAKHIAYAFVDEQTLADKELDAINKEYISARQKKKLPKKIILVDSELARKSQKKHSDDLTKIKLIAQKDCPFDTAVEIYDDKVSFLTKKGDRTDAFTLHHPEVAAFHQSLFLYVWNSLKS